MLDFKLIIKKTNIKLDAAIYDYIEEKIGSLEKFLLGIDYDLAEARVEVGKSTRHHRKGEIFRVEMNLSLPGKLLRAEAEKKDIYTAITTVKDEMQQLIKKYKSEPMAKYKRGARILKKLKSAHPLSKPQLEGRIREEGI